MIKSTATKNKAKATIQCPCLRESINGTIVLMTAVNNEKGTGIGTVVYCNVLNTLGQYSESWDIRAFNPYAGKVTLV